ncbi:MAG TPA: hypothetical protein VGP41_12675 [Candidatus Lustribacter sp.]|jgi:hypothetical protein|nr:hypothetical protein [Candidatus Lustribacter sp.]
MPSSPADRSGDDAVAAIAARLCGTDIAGIENCGGGGNNRVFRVQTRTGAFALKSYGPADADNRDRLGHEFDGLRFLRSAGLGSAVPDALAVDRDARCALYEWIDGSVPAEHGAAEVAAALRLLAALHGVRTAPGAAELPIATEAVLRPADLVDQLQARYARLAEVSDPDLAAFLTGELRPEMDRRLAHLADAGASATLEPAQRTLSPSDFGFHNALRRADGSLTFIDFEYFGWDDPVKLAADFLWHPAMRLSEAERLQFTGGINELYAGDPAFAARLAVYFPLYGIRWSLIILNEFLPERWARRAFAGKGGDWDAAKRTQLQKARANLDVLRAY